MLNHNAQELPYADFALFETAGCSRPMSESTEQVISSMKVQAIKSFSVSSFPMAKYRKMRISICHDNPRMLSKCEVSNLWTDLYKLVY